MKRNRWPRRLPFVVVVLLVLAVVPAASIQAINAIRVAPAGQDNPGCGLDWSDPCSLQTALARAGAGDEIWVQAGVYRPGPAGDPSATFLIPADVAVYGGFDGTETTRDKRDWIANPTILSGDIDENDLDPNGNQIAETWTDIVGENSDSVVSFNPDIEPLSPATILDGFTITAGRSFDGSGVSLQPYDAYTYPGDSSPTLRNLVFSGNDGNAVWIENDSYPTLANATFIGNYRGIAAGAAFGASGLTGHALTFIDNHSAMVLSGHRGGPTVDVSSITVTGSQGPAIWASLYQGFVNATFADATFDHNEDYVIWSSADYGTISMSFTDAIFINNQRGVFYGEADLNDPRAPFSGTELPPDEMPIGRGVSYTITNATFSGNRALADGGVLSCTSRHPGSACRASLINVSVTGNTSAGDGGAIYLHAETEGISAVDLRNTTLSGNQAGGRGGAIASSAEPGSTSRVYVRNSILWGNNANTAPELAYDGIDSEPVLSHSLVAGWPNDPANHVWGDRDPAFVAPATAPAPTTRGNYRLHITSPAIDAGDNERVPEAITTDLDGNPRFADVPSVPNTGNGTPPIVDMGAYEYPEEKGPAPTPTITSIATATPSPTLTPSPTPINEPSPEPTAIPTFPPGEGRDCEVRLYLPLWMRVY